MNHTNPKIKALIDQVKSGRLRTDRATVLDILMHQPFTLSELRSRLAMSHQTVTARLSELEEMGLIYKAGTRNGYSIFHHEPDIYRQDIRRKRVNEQKRQRWIKTGQKNGWISTQSYQTKP